jgi:hypothetical protein
MEPSATGHRLSPCAEFPNDNPSLHHGAIWRCEALTGDLTVRLPSSQPSPALVRMASEGLAKLARVVAGEPLEASEAPVIVDAIAEPAITDVEEEIAEEAIPAAQTAVDEAPAASAADAGVVDAHPGDHETTPDTEAVAGELVAMVEEPGARAEPIPEAIAELETEAMVAESEAIADLETETIAPESERATGEVDAPYEEDSEPDAIEIVDELCFDAAVDESDGAPSAPPPAAEDPFVRLVQALEGVAIAHGAGDESIRCMRALFGVTRSDGMAPGERATEALLAAGIVLESAQEGRGLVRSGAFTAQVVAWQGILRGESEDFAACGGAALDEWAAGVLARVLASPSKAEGLRRELRARGVAAFGLLADAA